MFNEKKYLDKIFIIVMLVSFMAWIVDIVIKGGSSEQLSLFFKGMEDYLADFINTVGYCAQRDPYNNLIYVGWEHKQYPPLAYIMFWMFSKFSRHMELYYSNNDFREMYKDPLILYMIILFYILISITIFSLVYKYKKGVDYIKYGVAISMILSYPFLHSLERGNNYPLVLVFVLLFIFNYDSSNGIKKEIALISLGIAFGLKLTPAIFGVFLLYDGKIKEAIRAAIYGLGAVVLPCFFFVGGLSNLRYFIRNLTISAEAHSAFSGVSILGSIGYFSEKISGEVPENQDIYMVLNYIICLMLFVFSFYYKQKWQKVLAITIVALSASGQAGGYSALLFVPFIILFLDEMANDYLEMVVVLIAIFMIMGPYRISGEVWNIHVAFILLVLLSMFTGVYEMSKSINRRKIIENE